MENSGKWNTSRLQDLEYSGDLSLWFCAFFPCWGSYTGVKRHPSIGYVTFTRVYIVFCDSLPEPSLCRGGPEHMCFQFPKRCCFSVRPPAAAQCVFVLKIWAWFSTTACTSLGPPCWESSVTHASYTYMLTQGLGKKCLFVFVCSFSPLLWRPWEGVKCGIFNYFVVSGTIQC